VAQAVGNDVAVVDVLDASYLALAK